MKACYIIFATFQRSASNCLPMLQNPSFMTFWLPSRLFAIRYFMAAKVLHPMPTTSPRLPRLCLLQKEASSYILLIRQRTVTPVSRADKINWSISCYFTGGLQLNSYWPKGSVTYRYLLLEMSLWRFGGGGLVLWRFWTQTPMQISIISSKSDTEIRTYIDNTILNRVYHCFLPRTPTDVIGGCLVNRRVYLGLAKYRLISMTFLREPAVSWKHHNDVSRGKYRCVTLL